MTSYKLTSSADVVQRVDDGANIPRGHRWFDEYELWLTAGGVPEPADGELKSKADLIAGVANRRYQAEIGGVTVGGVRINTEREAQAKLNAAFTSLQAGLIQSTNWKADDGTWASVDLSGLTPIAAAVAQHVSACFSAEKLHCDAITKLKTQSAIDAYDVNKNWPVN